MVFFKQIRQLIILFIFFGLWSSWWPGSKYKWILRIFSIYSVHQELMIVTSVIYSYDLFKNHTLSAKVENCMYMIISLTHLVIVIESLVKRDAQVKLIQKFTLVDHLFSTRLKIRIPYKKEKCQTFVRNFTLLSIIILLKSVVSGYLHYHSKILISWYPALFSIWIMCLRTIQVILFVFVMRCRLMLINNELKCIHSAFDMEAKYEDSRQRVFFSKYTAYNRIKILKKIYGELYEVYELVNEIFGWSILAITTQCFVDFTFNCYWAFLYLQESNPDTLSLLICISLLLPIAMLSSVLTFYCSSCYQQVRSFF